VKLGDMALKLERYRYTITSALGWVIFGMVFSSMNVLYSALLLYGIKEYWIIGPLMATAGVLGGYIYGKFWKFTPMSKEIRVRWMYGLILLFLPFVVSYTVAPIFINATPYYYTVVWYPSLGFGLLFCGLYAERNEYISVRAMPYAGVAIIATSVVFIQLAKLPMNYDTVIATGLLAVSMMLMVYLFTAIYVFFKAQRVVYEA